jgi:peptidoglycan/LPS O-acetylase OafA/YrhL
MPPRSLPFLHHLDRYRSPGCYLIAMDRTLVIRFRALDGLRGIAALAVALFHLPIAFSLHDSPLIRQAYVAVDLFFVLSGFVIAHAYLGRLTSLESTRDFVVRRIGRLWPLHAAVLAAMVVVEVARLVYGSTLGDDLRLPFSGKTSIEALFANIFLVHAWGMDTSWNIPSWSISAELFAYLAFAGVCLWAPHRARLAAVIILAVSTLVVAAAAGGGPMLGRDGIFKACLGFFAGMLVYDLYARSRRPGWSAGRATVVEATTLLGALGLAGAITLSAPPQLGVLVTPLFAVVVYVFAIGRGALSQLLETRPLQHLGAVSYSVYLVHGLVITAFNMAGRVLSKALDTDFRTDTGLVDFGRFWLNDVYALAFLAVVIGLATLTWRFVELPGQRLFNGWAPRQLTRSAAAA